MTSPFSLDSDGVIRVDRWREFDWLTHGFGTRQAAPPGGQVATAKQVHGARVLVAHGISGLIGEADALVTDVPGQTVAIRTADCVPALIIDPARRAVAAVHAGWRGTVAGIVREAVQLMSERYQTDPATAQVALGPCIGACCFEVGAEVAQEFIGIFPERNDLGERSKVDLIEANRRWALQAGVPPRNILALEDCTVCEAGLYHSYRRDKTEAGRLVAMAGVILAR